jgi:hypothetical protein
MALRVISGYNVKIYSAESHTQRNQILVNLRLSGNSGHFCRYSLHVPPHTALTPSYTVCKGGGGEYGVI